MEWCVFAGQYGLVSTLLSVKHGFTVDVWGRHRPRRIRIQSSLRLVVATFDQFIASLECDFGEQGKSNRPNKV